MSHTPLASPTGRLGVLMPGMGAVATTTMAGVMLARRGLGLPIGSLTQMGTMPLRRDAAAEVALRDAVPLAGLDQLAFGGWDLFPDDALASATHAEVLSDKHLGLVAEELRAVKPMTAVFYPEYVRRLHGTHVKKAASKAHMVAAVRDDIRRFLRDEGCDRAVAVWCGSTEVYREASEVHENVERFEDGLRHNSPEISNSQIYAWALVQEGVPIANGSPGLTLDFPAMYELARLRGVPLAGKDFKTGQTLMKTMIAPGLKARRLGLRGWYSTNILGNRDGEVLDDPDSFRSKEVSKLGVLESILPKDGHPELYGNVTHRVRIDYYPPRGDQKEGWDNVDLFGWLNYPMQMKINFLCRDSILAAPIVLDLALLLDLAQRAGMTGMQDWLGFYFKSPMALAGTAAEHDLFVQQVRLHDALRRIAREAV
ncbi:MAG: inositol-3-phosphate synthase [Deltaproteobacteria bacterium]|nr:inositol-3-phosphate synthase [Myxococcales bacterium]MDP3219953.1 inositol-3-phosphate synthase [Deltaproteobacteria bacterium]